MVRMDINCDMGERPEALLDGSEEALMQHVTSVNIACGGHAGDAASMSSVLKLAKKRALGIGAHPGFPDRVNFGRQEVKISPDLLRESIYEQLNLIGRLAVEHGCIVRHVKPHGALYTQAAKDEGTARIIAEGVSAWRKDVCLVGPAGSRMLNVWSAMGFFVSAEAFADRMYERDGSLRSRKFPDALIVDPGTAARQALAIALAKRVTAVDGSEVYVEADTICIHSDTPNAVLIAEAVKEVLLEGGVVLGSVGDIHQ